MITPPVASLTQFLKKALLHFALLVFLFEQFLFVYAATSHAADLPITPDGSTNTQVTKTASGIDQVNVAAPNNNGTSRNHFSDYNVNQSGQILNNFSGAGATAVNSTGAVVQTQIGGLVTTNPNLVNSGSAKLIIVEVTSNNVSKLLGYTEIAGSKAGLILANPNGITCAGCGFINASKLLMVAGSSNFDAAGNLGFNLKEPTNPNLAVPLITVEGLGLDVERLSAANIVASAIKVIGNIYGSNDTSLSLKSGTGRYDYAANNVISGNTKNNPLGSFALFAIDVSALTKIQSGQVFLIATSEGFGVNMAGEILARDKVNIDANGDIYYAKIASENEVALKSSKSLQTIDNTAKITAPNLNIAANKFSNSGNLIARDLTIQNSNKFTNSGAITALNLNLSNISELQNSNLLYGENSFKITAGFVSNYGQISAGKTLNLNANSLDNFAIIQSTDNAFLNASQIYNHEASLINSQNNLNFIAGNLLENKGEISALKNLKIDGKALLENFHKIIATQELEIFGKNLKNNSAAIIATLGGNITLTLSSDLENSGEFISSKNIDAKADKISNYDNFLADENLTLSSTTLLNFANLQSKKDLFLTTSDLQNSGSIKSFAASTIKTASLTNKLNAVIFSAANSAISANNFFTNYGRILSDAKLDLTLGQSENPGENSGEIFAKDDLTFTLNNALTNSGVISSLANFNVTANSTITNNNEISAGKNLDIKASNLTNHKTIAAIETITITTTTNITNNGTVQSSGNFTLNATSLINSAASLIISGQNLTITANSITNSNTKSANKTLTSGLISSAGLISLNTNSLNNDSGIIAAKSTSLQSLSNDGNVLLSNISGSFIATTAITLDLGNLDHIITGEINAANIDITANNITNLGKVTATTYIKLNATGTNNIAGSGNIVNGYVNNDILNQNVLLAAGSYINLSAKNNINNYGNILATTDLTLTSLNGNINNYAGNAENLSGKIQGGSGILTINALNGAFNNYNRSAANNSNLIISAALLSSNNEALINVLNLNNNGEIAVKNNLTANATNLNNNYSSLIWSDKDLILNVASTLINDRATIYANRHLTIQKNSAGDKTNLVQNISGTIETYGTYNSSTSNIEGDLTIKAVTLENKRSIDPGIWLIKPDRANGTPYRYDWSDGQYDLKFVNDSLYNWQFVRDRCFGSSCREYQVQFKAAAPLNSGSIAANIISGANMNLESTSILNDVSNIFSSQNLTINATSLLNQSRIYPEILYMKTSGRHNEYTDNSADFASDFAAILLNNDAYFASFIKAGKSFYGSGFSILRNITISPNYSKGNSTKFNGIAAGADQVKSGSKIDSSLQISKSTIVNGIDVYNLAETGAINLDLSKISQAIAANSAAISSAAASIDNSETKTIFSGEFKIYLTPNSNKPLLEGRSSFVDPAKFFGSDYFFTAMGIDRNALLRNIEQQSQRTVNSIRMLGDAFVETKLILDQIRLIAKDSLLLSGSTTDSTAQIKELLDNSASELSRLGLSASEVALNGLSADQVNSLTKDIVTFEKVEVGGNLVLAPKIYLSLASRNKLLGTNNSLAKNAVLFAQEDLIVDAPNATLFNSGSIITGNNLSLNMAILTNQSSTTTPSEIKSNADLSITANSGDIKNIGANIAALGDLNLTSLQGNILNSAIVQTNDADLLNSNSDAYQAGFGAAKTSGNITSVLVSDASIKGGAVNITAAKDFTNLAADITTAKNNLADNSTSSGNVNIQAGDDVNINSLQLHNRTESSWGASKTGGSRIIDTTKNIGSNLVAANEVTIIANASGYDSESSDKLQGANIQISGSNISATDNITLAAANNVNIEATQDLSYQQSQSWKKGLTVAKSAVSGAQSISNNLATLNSSTGNVVIASGNNTNLIGAKLKADDVTINAGAEINIYSVSDQNTSWASSSKSHSLANIPGGTIFNAMLISPILTYSGVDTSNSSQSSSQFATKTANIASVIEAKDNVALTSHNDLTISGSNISGKTGQLTSTHGDVNIISAIETETSTSSSSSSQRESNVPGFNGSHHSSSETTQIIRNVGSNLTFTESLEINASNPQSADQKNKGNININGSNVTVTNGDLALNAANNITIANAVDSSFKDSSSSKNNETTKSFSNAVAYVEHSVASQLNADNIKIQSRGDTVIQGSNINTKNNLIIGSFTIAQNSDGSYQKDANGNYITVSGSTVDNLIIKDAEVEEYHHAQNGKGYTGVAALGMRALPYIFAPIQITSDLMKKEMAILFPDALESAYLTYHPLGWVITAVDKVGDKIGAIKISTTSESRSSSTTSYASNINVGGSMMTNSLGDTTIQGSNINIAGDLLANTLGNFTIQAAQNTSTTASQTSYETAGSFHSNLDVRRVNYTAGVAKDFVESGSETSATTLTSSNVNIGGSALINTADQFNLLASNLITTGATEIAANNNLNISDAQATQSSSTYLDQLTLDSGIKVGNAYVDAAYSVVDAARAQKAVKDAYDKLEKIENLYDQGLASNKAVDRAKMQVVLALINAGLSTAAAMQAVSNAGLTFFTSGGTGFYSSSYVNITKLKSTTSSEYAQSIASNLQAGGDISLSSGNGDININGSNVASTNGNLNLTAMLGNLHILAGETTYSQSSKMRSQSLGGSAGNNGVSANIGFSQSESTLDQTTYSNSQLSALNGLLNINTGQDALIFGANLVARDVNLNVGGNLLVKSRQNLVESDFYSIGMSFGLSSSSGNSVDGTSTGFNSADGFQSRAWVDQLTSIIGTNSVTINTSNNTNLIGAMIANITNASSAQSASDYIDGGNLTLNTGSLTYSDLKNYNNSESNSFGISLSLGFKANDPSASQNSQSAQNTKGVVPGNLNLNLALQGSESSSNTKATIGRGIININNTATDSTTSGLNRNVTNTEQNKKTVITSNFSTNLSIDTRLITAGAASLASALGIDSADKVAASNWGSYKGDTLKGAKILGYSLHIPALSIYSYASQTDLTASDALYATAKNYDILYHLAYNPNITASNLAGEGNLISYDGKDVQGNINSKYSNGFYDRENDAVSVNVRENETNSELAGTLAHEGMHRYFNLSGRSYDLSNPESLSSYNSEEAAAHLVGDFTEGAWSTFQYDNLSLRASLPMVTPQSNDYANGVNFNSSNINPYQKDVHKYLTRYLAENAGFTPEEARQIADGNYKVDLAWNKQPFAVDWLVPFSNPKEDYHFTTHDRREDLKKIAYETGDMKTFGEYLHTLQDYYSHQNGEVPETPARRLLNLFTPQQSNTPYPSSTGHLVDSDWPDRTYNRPDLADRMAKTTYDEMQNFFIYKNTNWVDDSFTRMGSSLTPEQRSTNSFYMEMKNANSKTIPKNTWSIIVDNVKRFNRLPEEDNDIKGQNLFR